MSNLTTMSSSSERDLRAGDPVLNGLLACLKTSNEQISDINLYAVHAMKSLEFLDYGFLTRKGSTPRVFGRSN